MEPSGRQALHTPDGGDDGGDSPSLLQRARSIGTLHRALAMLIVFGALFALGFSSAHLWRPVGVLVLRKLWDVLRFVVLTTSIGVGIINSKLWRRRSHEEKRRERPDAVYSSDGGSDHVRGKVPFAGMFYSELQPSYSFDEKVASIAEDGPLRSAWGKTEVCDPSTEAAPGEAAATDHCNNESESENVSKLANDTMVASGHSSLQAEVPEKSSEVSSEGNVQSNAGDRSMSVDVTNERVHSVKASDDLNLGVSQRLKHGRTILHRRGASLEFPICEGPSLEKHGNGAHRTELDHCQKQSTDEVGDNSSSSSSRNPSVGRKASDPTRSQSTENLSAHATAEPASASTAMASSMHSRSQSAYDFSDLISVQEKPRRRRAAGGQLARRRRVSLSCDLDKDYRAVSKAGHLPSWPEGLVSPPMPPQLIDGGADRAAMASKQDEKSIRKAFTESLAPWRVEATAGEARNEGRNVSSKQTIPQGNAGRARAPLSPVTPKSIMGSPSPSELNRKVDAFIARFHERNRLQRLESLERSRQKV